MFYLKGNWLVRTISLLLILMIQVGGIIIIGLIIFLPRCADGGKCIYGIKWWDAIWMFTLVSLYLWAFKIVLLNIVSFINRRLKKKITLMEYHDVYW